MSVCDFGCGSANTSTSRSEPVVADLRSGKSTRGRSGPTGRPPWRSPDDAGSGCWNQNARSEEHTSELQSLMRISYAVFCLKKNRKEKQTYDHKTIKQKSNEHSRQKKITVHN